MKILWLSPRWPFPDNTGARKATMALLSELIPNALKLGIDNFELNLVCLYESSEDLKTVRSLEEASLARNNFYLQKPALPAGSAALAYVLTRVFHPFTPFTIQKYASRKICTEMASWMQTKQYDFTIIDGVHGAAFIDLNDTRYGQFIYRAHNVESELWRQLEVQEQNPLKKAVLKLEHWLSKKFETKVCQQSQMTFTVSELDQKKFKDSVPSLQVHSLPIGAAIQASPLPFSQAKGEEQLKLLFVGRLDWEPNKKGLDWFLKEVWPVVDQTRSVELTIIGSGDSEWLKKFQSANVRLLQNVPELKSYYEACHLTLIPLFMGSGTRVKAIESGNFGRSFVTTQIGVEGLPYESGKDYLRAETKKEWIDLLTKIETASAQALGIKIHTVTKNHFEKGALASGFLVALAALQDSKPGLLKRKEPHEVPHSQPVAVS